MNKLKSHMKIVKNKKVKFEVTLGPPLGPLPRLSQSQYHHHHNIILLKQSVALVE